MTNQEYIKLAERYEQQLTVIDEKIRQNKLMLRKKGTDRKQLKRSLAVLETMQIECKCMARSLRKQAEEAEL